MRAGRLEAAAFCLFLMALTAPSAARAQQPQPAAPAEQPQLAAPAAMPAYDQIATCLASGGEAVLRKSAVLCAAYRDGDKESNFEVGTPFRLDMNAICQDPSDWRRLNSETIAKLAADKDKPVAPSGIRILGAVFCDKLELVGLDLRHALVLDRSLFKGGIEARNLRVRADVSFERSLVLERFQLLRSQIEGSLFAERSFINNLVAYDTKVDGSVLMSYGMLAQALFDGITVQGELSLFQSALSTVLIELSTIRGSLNLSESEAQCWYRVSKSEVGEFVAAKIGFGQLDGNGDVSWVQRRALAALFEASLPVQQWGTSLHKCRVNGRMFGLVLSESRVRSTLCVQALHAVTPAAGREEETSLVISHTAVGSNAIINLWPAGPAQPPGALTLEAVGLTTGGLVLNFADSAKPLRTFINGLQFDRVYAGDIPCPQETFDTSQVASISGPSRLISERNLRAPNVEQVQAWLERNETESIQPFTAFIDAFDRAGDNAKALRIARSNRELAIQESRLSAAEAADPASKGSAEAGTTAYESWISLLQERAYIAFRVTLATIADHGYQPVKAVPWIIGLIVLYYILFWFGLGIVGFKSEKKTRILPVGMMFLFDRLIPLYNISDANHAISGFYRRAPRKPPRPADEPPDGAGAPAIMQYLWFSLPVEPAAEHTTRWADFWLALLKILGAILAVFVVAAVNALVTR